MIQRTCRRIAAGFVAIAVIVAQAIAPTQAAFATSTTTNGAHTALESPELPDRGDQPVWCQKIGNEWTIQIGNTGAGNNPNRFPLTIFPTPSDPSLYVGPNGQIYAPNSSSDALKGRLTNACRLLYTIATPAISIIPRCGTNNDTVIVMNSNFYSSTIGPWVNGVAIVNFMITTEPYTFEEGGKNMLIPVYEVDRTTCVQTIEIPIIPVDDPCGLQNAVFGEVPTGNYSVVRNNDGSITLTAHAGYLFEGNVETVTIPAPTDSDILCMVNKPKTPKPTDPCGLNNAYWKVPKDTPKYDWELNELGELVVTTVGVTFRDGTTFKNYGPPIDSGKLCETSLPEAPTFTDPCGLKNAMWTPPSDTDEYTWSIDEEGHLIATATANYEFPGGEKSIDFGVAEDSGKLCPVIPVPAPAFIDQTCTNFGMYTIPESENLIYTVQLGTGEEKVTPAGTYIVNTPASVTIRAYKADEISLFAQKTIIDSYKPNTEQVETWTHEYTVPANCTPGQGGNPETPAPQQPVTHTPAPAAEQLPTTGMRENATLLIIGAAIAILTYGAVYFANSRRQYK